MKKFKLFILIASLLTIGLSAYASDADTSALSPQFFIGADVSSSTLEISDIPVYNTWTKTTSTTQSDGASTSGWGLNLGQLWQKNKGIGYGWEAQYRNNGSFSYIEYNRPLALYAYANSTYTFNSIDLLGLVNYTWSNGFSVLVEAGPNLVMLKTTTINPYTSNSSSSSNQVYPMLGAGIGYRLFQHINISLTEDQTLSKGSLSSLSTEVLGVNYCF